MEKLKSNIENHERRYQNEFKINLVKIGPTISPQVHTHSNVALTQETVRVDFECKAKLRCNIDIDHKRLSLPDVEL